MEQLQNNIVTEETKPAMNSDKELENQLIMNDNNVVENTSVSKIEALTQQLLTTVLSKMNISLTKNDASQTQEILVEQLEASVFQVEDFIRQKNELILARLKSEEEILEKYQSLLLEHNKVQAKYQLMNKKYALLSQSKLGRLTLKYWKFRKRVPENY